MMSVANRFSTFLAIFASLPLAGCFTGIESTPKITVDEVKKQNIVVTAEQRFLADLGSAPLAGWSRGKRFLVTDNRAALAFGASGHGISSLKGGVLTYIGSDSVPAITGDGATQLTFLAESGDTLKYRIDAPVSVVKARQSVSLPFCIDLDIVAQAAERLVTKRVYLLTSTWFDRSGRQTQGRKFIPVTITGVAHGNENYPLYVGFVDSDNNAGGVYMSLGDSRQSTRNFETLFAFSDPHLRHPNVSDENWAKIINGDVSLEMTREECRLALGSPKEIDRRPGYGGVAERWTYTDGVYLLFEDGLLRDFRR